MCFLLFVLAFALRFYAADYGYFHGDERVNEAAKVLAGELVPGQHFYPPFINYLNAVALAGLFGVGLLAEWWSSPSGFRDQYFADPTIFYVTARMVTALTGALLAPLFFAVARQLGLDRMRALSVGMVAVLFPLGVFMAHIAKGDTGLATAQVAVIWAILARLQGGRGWDWVLGLCVVLTLSFKHSSVFVLLPLAVGLIVLLTGREGAGRAFRSFGRAVLVILLLWPVLNIGLLMDLRNFLDYQKIQAVMSLREGADGPLTGLITLFWRALELVFGLNPLMTGVTLMMPVLLWLTRGRPRRAALWVVWLSLILGTVVVALMAGPRQPEHLWIANFAGFLLLGAVLLAELSATKGDLRFSLAGGALAVSLMFGAYGTGEVLRQAAAAPVDQQIASYLKQDHSGRRIVSSAPLRVALRKDAQQYELERTERLARKYNVDMPPLADERLIRDEAPDALYLISMPGVMFGLDEVEDGDIDYEVKAYAWPLQKEEWQLEFWLEQGFDLFVIQDFEQYAYHAAPQLRQAFFQDMGRRCRDLRRFAPAKPLFLERDVVVFDCAAQ